MMNVGEAYVAGFYEGEGSIACDLQPRKYVPDYPHVIIYIPQNYIEPLKIVQGVVGEGVIDERRGNVNFVYRLEGYERCSRFIEMVKPMLSPRRVEQAENALETARVQIEKSEEYWKTCRHGHDMTNEDNVRVDKRGRKNCRTCARESNRRYRRRKSGKATG